MFTLKALSPSAIPAALARAERYRLLNQPELSESICEDILAADPGNHDARIALILSITDGFPQSTEHAVRASELAAGLTSAYERHYYGGLVAERRGRAALVHDAIGGRAGTHWLHQAMREYERAEELRPEGNDDARLRWNACARVFNDRPELLALGEEPVAPITSE